MSTDDGYTIRLYEPDDREGFLELYDTVFGGGSEEWFRWKYSDNPYVSHVPMFVAEHDGELVGARPYMAFRLRAGDERPLGLQTGDTMVHPDHQRKGLFTRMTSRSMEYYGDLSDDVLTFSVPNAISRSGYLKLGCREVGQLAAGYRLQNPGAFVGGTAATVAPLVRPFASAALRAWSRRAPVPDDLTVTGYQSVTSTALADLYEQNVPHGIHALRNERFYDWRFARPEWQYETYLARPREDTEPVAGVVVGRTTRDGTALAALTDVVPLVGGHVRERGLAAILDRVSGDHADADVLLANPSVLPASLLRAYGFLSDDRLPLSAAATPTILVTRIFDGTDDPPWNFAGYEIDDPDSWRLTFAEQNTF